MIKIVFISAFFGFVSAGINLEDGKTLGGVALVDEGIRGHGGLDAGEIGILLIDAGELGLHGAVAPVGHHPRKEGIRAPIAQGAYNSGFSRQHRSEQFVLLDKGPLIHKEVHYPPHPYEFAYMIVDDKNNKQYFKEIGDAQNIKKGSYGFKDTHGIYRQVDYIADGHGFRAKVSTNAPGTSSQHPANILMDAHPLVLHQFSQPHVPIVEYGHHVPVRTHGPQLLGHGPAIKTELIGVLDGKYASGIKTAASSHIPLAAQIAAPAAKFVSA
ncbi:cuticle protein-like protein [Dinothrombium tinctorium]|uniref:Cuticle protein-like protein n=1 Tax=Dinothrombium tinctorium TaxID=1965070 RepID=A0A3S3SDL5_9ACAR|nr:cuticle protein-like protein [Dinothrombium tinctorium]